jgi:thiamine-phosphate diphosphorylase
VDADGVHIGQDDVSIYTARKILGKGKLIGVSAHSVEEALLAEKRGANYLSFGSVFPSKTKKSVVRPLSILKEIKRAVQIPVFAIGGITLENMGLIAKEGIDGICISKDILERKDIEKRAKEYIVLIQKPNIKNQNYLLDPYGQE